MYQVSQRVHWPQFINCRTETASWDNFVILPFSYASKHLYWQYIQILTFICKIQDIHTVRTASKSALEQDMIVQYFDNVPNWMTEMIHISISMNL